MWQWPYLGIWYMNLFFSVILTCRTSSGLRKIMTTCSICQLSIISWEPEGHYQYSKMFRWEPEGHYHCINSIWGPFTLAKTKIQKTWVFCWTVYTARNTHNIQGFWHEKRMREKTRISYLCFGKWCACTTSLYLWPYTCSAHYVAGRSRVTFRWRSRTMWPKTRIIPARLERAFTLAKNQWNFGGVSKNHAAEVGFSIRVFWSVEGSCLATFNEKPECEKDSGFFMPV